MYRMVSLGRARLAVSASRPFSPFRTSPWQSSLVLCQTRTNITPCRLPQLAIAGARQSWVHRLHGQAGNVSPEKQTLMEKPVARRLPLQCTGCGAFSQTAVPGEAGYFDLNRKAIKEYLGVLEPKESVNLDEKGDKIVEEALQRLRPEELERLGLTPEDLFADESQRVVAQPEAPAGNSPPVCERCHQLRHHSKAVPIYHPSVDSLREIMEESPHKYNHVYHVIDAADFPMSLVPRLHELIGNIYLRTHNRRSRTGGRFYGNKKTEMSFIISRSDLLAPKKEMVDSLLPYVREVLRKALGRIGKKVRLGNVRLVSANRGWWTKPLKEEIYQRGGASWMVGKVNVGKSKLFENVFPKAQSQLNPLEHPSQGSLLPAGEEAASPPAEELEPVDALAGDAPESDVNPAIEEADHADLGEMLPPLRPEADFPEMPTVSPLPGTTASPIRIPFGGGRGELIDLPGLARSDLELHVEEKQRPSLVMKHRITPEQYTIKPTQSLLLGGFIRITPKTPDLVFLAANFTPLAAHLTGTEKAIAIQNQQSTLEVENISVPGTGEKVKSAGSFELVHDVTRERTGPLTRKDAVKLKPERLPFRVLGLDILIEGVGWVEIVAQVRSKDFPHESPKPEPEEPEESEDQPVDPWEALQAEASRKPVVAKDPRPRWPEVEVFTPEGRFIGSRPPMNGYEMNKSIAKKAPRLRRSMKGQKKMAKLLRRRQQEAAHNAD